VNGSLSGTERVEFGESGRGNSVQSVWPVSTANQNQPDFERPYRR
jgi:hypothetical protein